MQKDIFDRRRKEMSNRRAAPRNRNKAYALDEMKGLSDQQFQRMFRLTRIAFYWLLEKIGKKIEPQPCLKHLFHHSDKEISAETRLAMTLRWLAGGSYLDICFAFGISIGNFFRSTGVLWPTIEAINEELSIDLDLTDINELNTISRGFATYCQNRVYGCIMAVDGLLRTRCPTRKEVFNQMAYRNRSGFFGLVFFGVLLPASIVDGLLLLIATG